jgi:8-oxo-dGTP pyrophosphatase MutT (NUDIX family)
MAIRYRATALVIKDNKILLVKDKGKHDYSMPGGKIESKESTLQAGIREISEELRLITISAERLRYCDFQGQRAFHKVCLIKVEGVPHINKKELDGYVWWDMVSSLPVQGHVKKILREFKEKNNNF